MKYFYKAKLILAAGLVLSLFMPVAHWTIYLNAYFAEATIELATMSPARLITNYPEKAVPLTVVYILPLVLTLVVRRKLGKSELLKNCCHLLVLTALAVVAGYVRFCIAVADPLIGAYVVFSIVAVLAVMEFSELWMQHES